MSYDSKMSELKVRNMENLGKYLPITLPPNKNKITPFLFSTDKKDRELSFFFDMSSEVYARQYTEINFIGK